MLAGFGKDRFGFDGELPFPVLQIEERRSGRNTVGDLDRHRRDTIFRQHRTRMARTDAQHIRSGTQEESVGMEIHAEERLRRLGIGNIFRGLSVRSGRVILHLPEECAREGEIATEACIHLHLRRP